MGATTFITPQEGARVEEAFREAVAAARFEHGHGGYTGTVAAKNDFVIVDRTVRWLDEAWAEAEARLERGSFDKYGPCGALPYASPTREVQVEVTGGRGADWDSLVARAVRLERGETIVTRRRGWESANRRGYTVTVSRAASGHEVVKELSLSVAAEGWTGEPRDFTAREDVLARARRSAPAKGTLVRLGLVDASLTSRVVTTRAKGRRTRYVIEDARGDADEHTYATMAEATAEVLRRARAHVERAATPRPWHTTPRWSVRGVVESATGEALVSVTTVASRVRARVEARYLVGRGTPPSEPDGWIFFGWAAE